MLEDELKESDALEDSELEVELDDAELLTDADELDEVVAEPNNKTLLSNNAVKIIWAWD